MDFHTIKQKLYRTAKKKYEINAEDLIISETVDGLKVIYKEHEIILYDLTKVNYNLKIEATLEDIMASTIEGLEKLIELLNRNKT